MTNCKKIIFTIFLAMFALTGVVTPRPANAQLANGVVIINTVKWVWEKVEKVYDVVQGIVGAELSNRTVGMFLDHLAYEIATELAEGGAGGKPQFRTVSLKKSLANAGDKALGEFIGELTTKGFDELGINLCDPSLLLKLSATLALLDEAKPPQPKCDWQKVLQGWKSFDQKTQAAAIKYQLNSKRSGETDTLAFFKNLASQATTDIGVIFKLKVELNNRVLIGEKVLELSSAECQGYEDKQTPISDEVITHCIVNYSMAANTFVSATEIEAKRQLEKKRAAENVKLSSILKDAGNQFLNTFTSKLMKNWIQKGMWSLFGNTDNDIYNDYRNTLIDRLRGGANIRQPRGADIFQELKTVSFEALEEFDYFSDFVICPNQFRGPDNCVMSPTFLQAINNKMTIQEAIDVGIINGDIPFIHKDDALNHTIDKCYREGLCYANLVKLRKANMIPVGWELVAKRALEVPASLQQAIDCFEESPECDFPDSLSDDYRVNDDPHNPFYHLVDPNWVMKAPGVRCDAYAFSPILESPESSNRQQYCADPRVCLQEDADGNCLAEQFNYCTRSENIWHFEGEACKAGAIYAGCLTFNNKDFGVNSYLQDTLEYCTADQAGCLRYSPDKDADGNWVFEPMNADPNDLFLNRQVVECKSERAGCSEYIVLAADTDANLITNGSFDNLDEGGPALDGWEGDGITDPDGEYSGGIYLSYDGDKVANGYWWIANAGYGGDDTNRGAGRLSTRVDVKANAIYALSIDAAQYEATRNDSVRISMVLYNEDTDVKAGPVKGIGTCEILEDVPDPTVTQLFFRPTDTDMERGSCSFMTNSNTDWISIEIQAIGDASAALWYDNVKLEALSSPDLAASAYSDYGVGAKIYMDSNAVMCTKDEAGCQGYVPANGDPMIPAVIVQEDLCPAECVGYATFTEQPDIFDVIEHTPPPPVTPVEYYNFIADTAQQCPDQAIGCEEFTNLDVIAQGGEGREYFTYLRQCVEEDRGQVYYTWEGTEVAGYQIKTWYALETDVFLGRFPCTNMAPEGDECLDDDPGYTPAACGDETADPNDDLDVDPNCRAFFDALGNVHYRFQDRVIFATDNCHDYRRALTDQIYKAVPEESIYCAEANNGCRSYYGNNANNIRIAFSDNFEDGTYAPWEGVGLSVVDLSNESLNNNGHSLKAETGNIFARDLSNLALQDNKEYIVSWWMKSDAVLDSFDIRLEGLDNNGIAIVPPLALVDSDVDSTFQNIEPGRWHYYTSSAYLPDWGDFDIGDLDFLRLHLSSVSIPGEEGLYIDNFTLKEVENSFAVVRNSWNTPVACDTPYEGFHLGCQSYRDLNGRDFDLKSFDRLCREEAIGCMPVIDTQNSSNPFEETFHPADLSAITIEADELTYLVPDSANYCPKADKGCTELGLPNRLDQSEFATVYKINDPDKYSSIMCMSSALYCAEYNTSKGVFYLKDPGANTCTYQQNILINDNLYSGWFHTSSLGDDVPTGCSDEGAGFQIGDILFPRDYCSVAQGDDTPVFYFTSADCINNGGWWNDFSIAAQCPKKENLCTSFKDPMDPIGCDPMGRNLNVGNGSRDGYCSNNSPANKTKKECLASDPSGATWTPYCQDYYYYDKNKIDETSCNGLVSRDEGCVLFNDINNWSGDHRQIITTYNTAATYTEVEEGNRPTSPIICDSDNLECDANRLIKVTKDRQCAEWLACKSSTASLDPNTEQYKIICDDIDDCQEFQYDSDSNTTKCIKWDSYDDPVYPTDPPTEALTFEKYQSRGTGPDPDNYITWSDKEYIGYSIPDTIPVGQLSVYVFGSEIATTTRLVYGMTDESDDQGPYYTDCVDAAFEPINGKRCKAELNNDPSPIDYPENSYIFRGECQDRVCWVNPLVDITSNIATSTYGIETRAYAIADAPFAADIEPTTGNRLAKYNGANICTNDPELSPNACEISFKKVTFGIGQDKFYYPKKSTAGTIPGGICTSGDQKKISKDCGGDYKNYNCDSYNDVAETDSRHDGICSLKTEVITFMSWPGICLEYDYNNPVTKDGQKSYYCNQWYPAQKIKGTASLYDNYDQAGYFEPNGREALFCAVTEPYVIEKDRYYCGYFDGDTCNVLLKIPAGSKINVSGGFINLPWMEEVRAELLKEGAWMEENPTKPLINSLSVTAWDASGNTVDKDIILTNPPAPRTKFSRFTDFNEVGPVTRNDFMFVINTLFDPPGLETIHRFYWDMDVNDDGTYNANTFVYLPSTEYYYEETCGGNLPDLSCPANEHYVYGWRDRTGHCGTANTHRIREAHLWCNQLADNYYVDVNSGLNAPIDTIPYAGSCTGNCKFTTINDLASNHGIGCLQSSLAPIYSNILIDYTGAGGFDQNLCNITEDANDCNFVNCVENLQILDPDGNIIINPTTNHSCFAYDACLGLATTAALYTDITTCFGSNGDGVGPLPQIYDANDSETHDQCMIDHADEFQLVPILLGLFCSSCSAATSLTGYSEVSAGVDCDAFGSIHCYQQCKVITRLNNDSTYSAIRTDIWWRSKDQDSPARISTFNWRSWYSTEGSYYRSNASIPTDDEIVYTTGLANNSQDNVFSHWGASLLGDFRSDRLILTRTPYDVDNAEDQVATFFSPTDWPDASTQMQGLFFKVYNLEWLIDTYQNPTEYTLPGGNNNNPFAGDDYPPRILANDGDKLVDVFDSDSGEPLGAKQGFTVIDRIKGTITNSEATGQPLSAYIKFFYHAHPDHMPIYDIGVDWGDGPPDDFSSSPGRYQNFLPAEYCNENADAPSEDDFLTPSKKLGFAGTEEACWSGYRVFYHVYEYQDGFPCTPDVPGTACYYPQVRVIDNWKGGELVGETTEVFDGRVMIYDTPN